MKIIACLSWYDESPTWLAAAIASAARFCDHVVAVDGAYALFPQGQPRSSSDQHEAIKEAALASGLGLTLHVPSATWQGNEVEKRSFLFHLALQVAEPLRDWLFVLDADEVISSALADMHAQLERTKEHVGLVTYHECHDPESFGDVARVHNLPTSWGRRDFPKLFRALPGLHVSGTHSTYVAPADDDSRLLVLWGDERLYDVEPGADFSQLVVEHRSHLRPKNRRLYAHAYYNLRDSLAIEGHSRVLVEGLDGQPELVR